MHGEAPPTGHCRRARGHVRRTVHREYIVAAYAALRAFAGREEWRLRLYDQLGPLLGRLPAAEQARAFERTRPVVMRLQNGAEGTLAVLQDGERA